MQRHASRQRLNRTVRELLRAVELSMLAQQRLARSYAALQREIRKVRHGRKSD